EGARPKQVGCTTAWRSHRDEWLQSNRGVPWRWRLVAIRRVWFALEARRTARRPAGSAADAVGWPGPRASCGPDVSVRGFGLAALALLALCAKAVQPAALGLLRRCHLAPPTKWRCRR